MELSIYISGLLAMLFITFMAWVVSAVIRNVAIIDSFWSIFFFAAAAVYLFKSQHEVDAHNLLLVVMIGVWAIRLCLHLTIRNWGKDEDSRYRDIRKKYSPHFTVKSLFIVFVFQAVLAWLISMPLYKSLDGEIDLSPVMKYFFYVGAAVWAIGFIIETVADYQLTKFKQAPDQSNRIMDKGFWRYSRHPNYFGEFLIWWGFYLIAVSYGGWWTIISPLIMSWLLMKFSGVGLLESTIVYRRPKYRCYIERTNAFFPGPVKSPQQLTGGGC